MMKKIMAAFLAVMLCACGSGNNGKPAHTPVTISNPVELETMTAAMGEYEFLEDENPAFTEITLAESIRMFKEKGTGILYYGRVGCWWCQRAVPVLNDAAKEMGVTVYYIDVQLPTTEAAYNELESLISSIFETDASTGKPVFKVPEVIGVKDGEIVGHHLSLVSSFEPDGDDTMMNDEQKAELKGIYEDIIAAVAE